MTSLRGSIVLVDFTLELCSWFNCCIIQVAYYPTDVTGTGEVDHELASEKELEKEQGEKETEDEGVLPTNYKLAHISEELAALGYYARSTKPPKGWLAERESLLIF